MLRRKGRPPLLHFFPGNCIVPDDGCPVRLKHLAVLVIKSWETKSCVELLGTDWRWQNMFIKVAPVCME
jgi:hypothetical protein